MRLSLHCFMHCAKQQSFALLTMGDQWCHFATTLAKPSTYCIFSSVLRTHLGTGTFCTISRITQMVQIRMNLRMVLTIALLEPYASKQLVH